MLRLSMSFLVSLFHRTRNINHGQKDEDECLNRAGKERQKHNRHRGQERENILVKRSDDQLLRKDVAEESHAEREGPRAVAYDLDGVLHRGWLFHAERSARPPRKQYEEERDQEDHHDVIRKRVMPFDHAKSQEAGKRIKEMLVQKQRYFTVLFHAAWNGCRVPPGPPQQKRCSRRRQDRPLQRECPKKESGS